MGEVGSAGGGNRFLKGNAEPEPRRENWRYRRPHAVPARQRAQAVWSLNGSTPDVTTVLHLLKGTVRPSVSKLQGLGLRISVSSTHTRMKIQSARQPHWFTALIS